MTPSAAGIVASFTMALMVALAASPSEQAVLIEEAEPSSAFYSYDPINAAVVSMEEGPDNVDAKNLASLVIWLGDSNNLGPEGQGPGRLCMALNSGIVATTWIECLTASLQAQETGTEEQETEEEQEIDPCITNPTVGCPGYIDPCITNPTVGCPGYIDPCITNPTVGCPGYIDPCITNPTVGCPGYIDPCITNPTVGCPGYIDPGAACNGQIPCHFGFLPTTAPGLVALAMFGWPAASARRWAAGSA